VAGTGTALQLVANAAFVQAVPPHLRGRAFGVAGTVLTASQGLVLLGVGGVAEVLGAGNAIALVAGTGLLVLAVVVGRQRVAPHRSGVQGHRGACRGGG
jgi:hypothetical protein